jgi:hypothetical protein
VPDGATHFFICDVGLIDAKILFKQIYPIPSYVILDILQLPVEFDFKNFLEILIFLSVFAFKSSNVFG